MSQQRQRFQGATAKAEEANRYRVDPTSKPSMPFSVSSKNQTPNSGSKAATQTNVIPPALISTMPIQSHSVPPDFNKKRAAQASGTPVPKKKPKVPSKRSASLSNDLHSEQYNRKVPPLEEKPEGTFPNFTNGNNIAYDVSEPIKEVAPVNEVINRNIQVVVLTFNGSHYSFEACCK